MSRARNKFLLESKFKTKSSIILMDRNVSNVCITFVNYGQIPLKRLKNITALFPGIFASLCISLAILL